MCSGWHASRSPLLPQTSERISGQEQTTEFSGFELPLFAQLIPQATDAEAPSQQELTTWYDLLLLALGYELRVDALISAGYWASGLLA